MILTNNTHPKVGQYYLVNGDFEYIVAVDYTYSSDSVSVYWLKYTTDYILKKDTDSLVSIMNFVYDGAINRQGV